MCVRRRIRKQRREELLFGWSTDEDGVVKKKEKKDLDLVIVITLYLLSQGASFSLQAAGMMSGGVEFGLFGRPISNWRLMLD